MSNYLNKNSKDSPYTATLEGLCSGAASMNITHQNGAIEVTHADGSVLLQAKNVRSGTWNEIWRILSNCGETDFRAGGK